jgi:hypothetical protein
VKELGDALQWLFDAIRAWLQCVARPVATLNAIVPETTDENHLSEAAKVWVPALLISLIISFPVLKFYGIEWNNVGYHLTTWTTTIVGMVGTAFIAHHILLGLNLKSEFVRTLVLYTVPVATYAPVLSLLTVPSKLSIFAAVQGFKQHPVAIDAAVVAYVHNATNSTSIFGMGVLTLFAESVSQWYGNNRFKCYSAVAVSGMLSTIFIAVVLTPIQFLTMYAFLTIAPS